ncbi:MAG: hypothetical protein HY903_08070 [Deltaproteobacteria bacterium]|nr:hypothetical protein [Deltaproteobacteria bacterium]
MAVGKTLVLSVGVLWVTACGGDSTSGGNGGGGGTAVAAYLPLGVGASWVYRVTDTLTQAVANKSNSVEAFEDVGGTKVGIQAYRVRTQKLSGETVSWQAPVNGVIIRYREQELAAGSGALEIATDYTPSKLRVDMTAAHTASGATWNQVYTEAVTDYRSVAAGATTTSSKTDSWTVLAAAEAVTVPAGTFTCLKLRKTNATTGSDKTYWYAADVGKVKELGGGQTEELVSYTIPAP